MKNDFVRELLSAHSVGVLTGAGVSTLCGIPDFRGPQGLYRQKDAEKIFDIDWFDRDPSIYYRGCRALVYSLDSYRPGPVHLALKKLEEYGVLKGIATQNIDMLHQKAGSSNVYEVHGSPMFHHCQCCGGECTFDEIKTMINSNGGIECLGDGYIPRCSCGGVYKPDITFFGEALPEEAFEKAILLAKTSKIFLVLGTSLSVFPAANLPKIALQARNKVVIVNSQPTMLDEYAYQRFADLKKFAEMILSDSIVH